MEPQSTIPEKWRPVFGKIMPTRRKSEMAIGGKVNPLSQPPALTLRATRAF
jgi:hypothetical protein